MSRSWTSPQPTTSPSCSGAWRLCPWREVRHEQRPSRMPVCGPGPFFGRRLALLLRPRCRSRDHHGQPPGGAADPVLRSQRRGQEQRLAGRRGTPSPAASPSRCRRTRSPGVRDRGIQRLAGRSAGGLGPGHPASGRRDPAGPGGSGRLGPSLGVALCTLVLGGSPTPRARRGSRPRRNRRPQVSGKSGDLRSAGWLGRETGHNAGRSAAGLDGAHRRGPAAGPGSVRRVLPVPRQRGRRGDVCRRVPAGRELPGFAGQLPDFDPRGFAGQAGPLQRPHPQAVRQLPADRPPGPRRRAGGRRPAAGEVQRTAEAFGRFGPTARSSLGLPAERSAQESQPTTWWRSIPIWSTRC